jgi:1,6-anhydro-N-acetylmuramate kinase
MTQSNENGNDRLDRIEAIILELATASVRHDNEFSRINAQQEANTRAIASLTAGQELNRQAIASLTAGQELNRQAIANLTAEQQLSRQDINSLTASILELRNLVADYIEGRSRQ